MCPECVNIWDWDMGNECWMLRIGIAWGEQSVWWWGGYVVCLWRIRTRERSENLAQFLIVQSVAEVVKRGKLWWFGHVECKSGDDWVSTCRNVEVPCDWSLSRFPWCCTYVINHTSYQTSKMKIIMIAIYTRNRFHAHVWWVPGDPPSRVKKSFLT